MVTGFRWRRNDGVGKLFKVFDYTVGCAFYGCGDIVGEFCSRHLWRFRALRRRSDVGLHGWVRVIDCVAVPPPEPKWIWHEWSVLESGFGTGASVRVKHEPQQLLVIGV